MKLSDIKLKKLKKPSIETMKRSLWRALHAGINGALLAFILIPVNLDDPKKYFYALLIGLVSGFLLGVQKFIGGYLKYDI